MGYPEVALPEALTRKEVNMRRPRFDEPLPDEALEQRAWEFFETAREQGSQLDDDRLIQECRQLAYEAHQRREALGNEPVPEPEEE
jgi:hypothetical protein